MPADSASLPLFEKSCLEVLELLSTDASEPGLGYKSEARELLAILDSWKQNLPEPADRTATIQRILELYRVVKAYLLAKPTPAQG